MLSGANGFQTSVELSTRLRESRKLETVKVECLPP